MKTLSLIVAAVVASAAACSPQGNSASKQEPGKISQKAATSSASASPSTSQPIAMPGPFGIAMGEDIAKLNASPIKEKRTYYEISDPPRPNPEIAEVAVQAAPGIGVCFIKGIGSTFRSDDFGMAARAHADALGAQLETKYGKGELIDRLAPWEASGESRKSGSWGFVAASAFTLTNGSSISLRTASREFSRQWFRQTPTPTM